MSPLGVVALFNSNLDAADRLARVLERAGFDVVSALIPEVRDGRCDVSAIMRHDPVVVVYDIAEPYEENWALFEHCRTTAMLDRRFVITSADARRVAQMAGRDDRIFEIVDRPFDLDNVVQAVKEAARARRVIPAASSGQASNVTAMMDRRLRVDRRQSSWTSNDIYRKLREKREEMEFERRRFGRRATDRDTHAA
jgi:DNA-binding response OmpR family regulator